MRDSSTIMRGDEPVPFTSDGAPDWDLITFDAHCARCGYNLRSLKNAKCTECGLDFDWRDVFERDSRHQEFLFEHAYLDRPVRSWLRTITHAFRTRRFWKHVSIHDDVEPLALWVMLLSAPIAFVLILHGTALLFAAIFATIDFFAARRLFFAQSQYEILAGQLFDLARFRFGPERMLPFIVGSVWVIILAMVCSLRQTLARCRVLTTQVLRVVAYVAPPVSILWAIFFLANFILSSVIDIPDSLVLFFLGVNLVLHVLAPVLYLAAGIKHYLRIRQAATISAVSTIVAILFTLTATIVYSILMRGGF